MRLSHSEIEMLYEDIMEYMAVKIRREVLTEDYNRDRVKALRYVQWEASGGVNGRFNAEKFQEVGELIYAEMFFGGMDEEQMEDTEAALSMLCEEDFCADLHALQSKVNKEGDPEWVKDSLDKHKEILDHVASAEEAAWYTGRKERELDIRISRISRAREKIGAIAPDMDVVNVVKKECLSKYNKYVAGDYKARRMVAATEDRLGVILKRGLRNSEVKEMEGMLSILE